MATVRREDLVQSVADALQFISYYHPPDFVQALGRAYERERSPAAKDAIAQILTNSRMSAEGHRPMCQDTGIVNVFLKIGMSVRLEGFDESLEDAVNELKARGGGVEALSDRGWSPQINTGAAVLIPEDYVADLNVRLALYRRLSEAEKPEDREALAAELIDRFGPLPPEAGQLLKVVAIKGLCRQANVSKIDVGPKGAVITFRADTFANPVGLVTFVQRNSVAWKLRPDQKVVVKGEWTTPEARLSAAEKILTQLAQVAAATS